jgi:hypothetical protein
MAGENTREQVARAYHVITGERFCSACNSVRKAAGGVWRSTGTVRRWMCAACVERRANRTPSNSR